MNYLSDSAISDDYFCARHDGIAGISDRPNDTASGECGLREERWSEE
jgi:hypothetical protein